MSIHRLGVALAAFLALSLLASSGAEAYHEKRGRRGGGGGGGGATTSEGCLPGVLKTRLSQIRKKFGAIRVVSTHRPGARINGSGKPSYHGSCRAVDFVPPSGKYKRVLLWLYGNHEGGIGNYTCMNHIHIDNGPNVRFTKCR